jgi:aspartyl-tRNA(Asn)/glutamyl-tRNA(Gln) amidotransferase subunit A
MSAFDNPVIEAGLAGLVHFYEDRAITPVEATEAYLSRIERLDPAVGAFVHLDREGALAAAHESAARWRDRAPLSPLDGAAIAVKSNIAVAGLPWTAGAGAYRERIAETDAAAVAALKASGAVILGLVNMEEGALGAVTDNPWFGRTHNPWRRDYTAGGSSGGSAAAVAAGFCAAALGTDTLGSVRLPSAYCGVVGHKPTQGLVSAEGVMELSWTLDHVGVHARSVQDAALLFAAASRADRELAEEMAVITPFSILKDAPLAALDLSGLDQVEPRWRRASPARSRPRAPPAWRSTPCGWTTTSAGCAGLACWCRKPRATWCTRRPSSVIPRGSRPASASSWSGARGSRRTSSPPHTASWARWPKRSARR